MSQNESSTARYFLAPTPGWRGFKLTQEGDKEAKEFDQIAEALDYLRAIPAAKGGAFIVFDDEGKQMARLTV